MHSYPTIFFLFKVEVSRHKTQKKRSFSTPSIDIRDGGLSEYRLRFGEVHEDLHLMIDTYLHNMDTINHILWPILHLVE